MCFTVDQPLRDNLNIFIKNLLYTQLSVIRTNQRVINVLKGRRQNTALYISYLFVFYINVLSQ